MNPIPFDRLGIPEEILRLRPPTTAAQAAARRKAREAMEATYPPRCYVAYVDNWTGDELDRVVVAASTDWDEYQRQLVAVPQDVRARVEIDEIYDPEDGIFIGGAF